MKHALPLVTAAALSGLLASSAAAQFPGDNDRGLSRQERYDQAARGATIDEWVRRLDDEDPATRLEAVKSLGESKDPDAVDYLMQAAGDPDLRVQAKAIEYLGSSRATGAATFLVQRLFMNGTTTALRHRILMALGKIGDPRATRPILEFLARDIPPNIRGTGIFAIGEIADPAARADLVHMRQSEENPRLQQVIDEALQKIAARQPVVTDQRRGFPSALEAALQVDPPPGG